MIFTLHALALFFVTQQQPLPDAPQAKVTPTPLQIPAKTPPPNAASGASPDGSKADSEEPESGLTALDKLSAQDRFVVAGFLRQNLRPAVQKRWLEWMPAVAKGKRTWYGTVKNGKTGTVRIPFKMHKDGSITEIKLEDSSGDDQLDRAAMQAVKATGPLPIPKTLQKDSLWIRAVFMYNPKHIPPGAAQNN